MDPELYPIPPKDKREPECPPSPPAYITEGYVKLIANRIVVKEGVEYAVAELYAKELVASLREMRGIPRVALLKLLADRLFARENGAPGSSVPSHPQLPAPRFQVIEGQGRTNGNGSGTHG